MSDHCNLQKTQLPPPFGPSVDSLCHSWFTTPTLSYRLPIFETSATALCGTTGIQINVYGRKFRSQTSDNMDRWKSRGGKSQRKEKQKREDQRRERVRKKKMQVREKVGKVVSFGKMILRDRCSTSYDLASLLHGRRSTFDRWSGKIAKRIGKRPSALHSTFHFWRTSRRIASFLMLSTSRIEEVLQSCFVFEVVKLESWRRLAESLRFWCCQVQKLRKSPRINAFFQKLRKSRRTAAFSSLQVDRQIDRLDQIR